MFGVPWPPRPTCTTTLSGAARSDSVSASSIAASDWLAATSDSGDGRRARNGNTWTPSPPGGAACAACSATSHGRALGRDLAREFPGERRAPVRRLARSGRADEDDLHASTFARPPSHSNRIRPARLRCTAPPGTYPADIAPAAAMEFHSSLAESHDLTEACDAVASDLRRRLGDAAPDVLIVFASAAYGDALDRLPVLLHERVGAPVLVGGTGAAQIDTTYMSEQTPALVALAGRAPRGSSRRAPSASRTCRTPTPRPPTGAACCPRPQARSAAWWCSVSQRTSTRARCSRGSTSCSPTCRRSAGSPAAAATPTAARCSVAASASTRAPCCSRSRATRRSYLRAAVIGRAGAISKAAGNRLTAVDGVPAKRFVEQQLKTSDAKSRAGREQPALPRDRERPVHRGPRRSRRLPGPQRAGHRRRRAAGRRRVAVGRRAVHGCTCATATAGSKTSRRGSRKRTRTPRARR